MVVGEKSDFAIEYEFAPNFSEKTYGYISLWIQGENLCRYNGDRQYEGDLYYIIDWFCGKIEYILGYDLFPLPVAGDNTLELIEKADKFESDIMLEFDLWYAAKSRWILNHCWFVARGCAVLPCVYFRRVEDFIEIAWDNEFWEQSNIIFESPKGIYLVNFEIFTRVISIFLFTAIIELKGKINNDEKIEEMMRQINILNRM